MASTRWKTSKRGSMYLTANPRGELVLPHYPFPDNRLDFMRCGRGKCELEIDHRWEGFCTIKGELIQIGRKNRGRHLFELNKGDYASVARDDLRILVRIGPEKAKSQKNRATGTNAAYRASPMSVYFSTANEWKGLAVAALVTSVILGGALVGLANRPLTRPKQFADLPPEYVLPFIGEKHFKTSPEALQFNLDRRRYLASVIDHYTAFTGMLLGDAKVVENQVFPTTRADYVRLYDDVAQKIETAIEKQKINDEAQLIKKGMSVLSVPTVIGESADGSMLRLLDKITIMQTALEQNIAAKKAIVKEFPTDPNYDYEEYKNVTHLSDDAKEKLAQIQPWNRATDEELMYADAEKFGRQAAAKSRRIYENVKKTEFFDPTAAAAVGLASGSAFASFAGDIDFLMSDEKFYQIQASEWGIRPTKSENAIREPLVGEIDPDLIENHIQKNRFQLQLCYELALRRNEAAEGTMEWKWRIDSRGVITDLALVSSNIQDQKMVNCIRQKIGSWRFPRPRRGSVEINYPFEFEPSKG